MFLISSKNLPVRGDFYLLRFEFLGDAGFDAACFVFLNDIGFRRFVYCRVEAGEEVIGIIKFACNNKFFDFFQSFFILVASLKILAVSPT